MKQMKWMFLVSCVLATCFTTAGAQETNDVRAAVVVSLKSFDELMSDVGYLTRTAGTPEIGGLVTVMASQYTDGINTRKPIGMYLTFDGEMPTGVVFVPINDLDRVLAKVQEQVGEPEELGNGVRRIQLNREIFLKERDGWVYISDAVANLSRLPQDPVSLLGGLEKQYDLAVRLYVQNIPEGLRNQAIAGLQQGVNGAMEQQGDEENAAEARKLAESLSTSLTSLIRDADQVTIGWNADGAKKVIYLEQTVTAKSGTELARQFSSYADLKSAFAGFLMPDAAVSGTMTSRLTREQATQAVTVLGQARESALKEIAENEELKDEAAQKSMQEAISSLFSSLQKTVEGGMLDAGFVVDLTEGSLALAGGGLIANEQGIEAALVKLVQLSQDNDDFPEVEYNAATHGNVRFHRMTIPVDEEDEDAFELFGEEVDLHIGLGAGAIYFALGEEGLSLLEEAIDVSQEQAEAKTLPLHLSVALGPILAYAAEKEEDETLATIAEALEDSDGNDHITITAKTQAKGLTYRLQLQEGVLQALGQAARVQQQKLQGQ